MEQKNITAIDLANLLHTIKEETIVEINYEGKQSKLNGGAGKNKMELLIEINPKEIKKVSKTTAKIGDIDYSKMVNEAMKEKGIETENDGEFQSKGLPWGQFREGNRVIIDHKGKSYLRFYPIKGMSNSHYEYQGDVIDIMDEKFDPWRKVETEEKEEPIVFVNCVEIVNIKSIKIDDVIYNVVE